MRSCRGSITAQVMGFSLVVLTLAAAIARSRMQPAVTTADAVERLAALMEEQAALHQVSEVWSRLGSCASDAAAGVNCAGTGCACACTVSGAADVVARPAAEGSCALSIAPSAVQGVQ